MYRGKNPTGNILSWDENWLFKHGWLAYWWGGLLFRISFDLHADALYPDRGCNAESYCDERIVELETLGPLEMLASGAASYLAETWELQEGLDSIFIPEDFKELLQSG